MLIREVLTKKDEITRIRDAFTFGNISGAEYLRLTEAHHATARLIREDIDAEVESSIQRMLSCGTPSPTVGDQYIPIPFCVYSGRNVSFSDCKNTTPFKHPAEFLTLVKVIDNDNYIMEDQQGKAYRYPDDLRSEFTWMGTILASDERSYKAAQLLASLLFNVDLPELNTLDEYAVLGHEPTRNPKYLGPTEKVNSISVLNSPYGSAKEKTLSNKFFGGS